MFLNALKPNFLSGRFTAATARTDFSEEDLRTLAGLSDAAFIASDDESSSTFMRISEKAAAIIILSGRGSSALIGKAYARFGAIYSLEGDYAGSNRAYNEATLAGFVPAWVWRAKADASRMLQGGTAGGILFPNRVRDAAAGALPDIEH